MKTAGRWPRSLAAGALLATGTALSMPAASDAGEEPESEAERVARRCVHRTFETTMGDGMPFVRETEHAQARRWIEENPFTFAEVARQLGAGEEFALEDEHRRGLEIEALLRGCRHFMIEQLIDAALSLSEAPD